MLYRTSPLNYDPVKFTFIDNMSLSYHFFFLPAGKRNSSIFDAFIVNGFRRDCDERSIFLSTLDGAA